MDRAPRRGYSEPPPSPPRTAGRLPSGRMHGAEVTHARLTKAGSPLRYSKRRGSGSQERRPPCSSSQTAIPRAEGGRAGGRGCPPARLGFAVHPRERASLTRRETAADSDCRRWRRGGTAERERELISSDTTPRAEFRQLPTTQTNKQTPDPFLCVCCCC